MYKIKQIPEDFKVIELPERKFLTEGPYQVWKLTKKNYNTEDAVQQICRALRLPRKFISYAGTKDRNAVTEQFITIKNKSKETIENIELKDITLEYQGCLKSPLSLGELKGNKFIITIRNISSAQLKKLKRDTKQSPESFPNYFDEQRFQKNNAEIGKLLVKGNFEEAYKILKEDYQYGELLKNHVVSNKNEYINAIRQIPKKILKLYIHSYQSLLWNKTLQTMLNPEDQPPTAEHRPSNTDDRPLGPDCLPLIGFGTETEDEQTEKIINKIMQEENIDERDFIIREIPELSAEGTKRKTIAEIKNLKIHEAETDELNTDHKYKIKLEFELDKGSYATMAIKYLLKD